jgi:tetratricopeptide (TPR) repeat protein/tRNA A-37 threonylcarbamoyl transferase component Bud32
MKPERWQQIENVFNAALACPPRERAALLVKTCGGDEALRREVESLLDQHERTGGFRNRPPWQAAPIVTEQETSAGEPSADAAEQSRTTGDLAGRRVGRFAVRARLGKGGMGEVYLADDTKLKRRVALKRVPPRLRSDEQYRRRLLKEAERASGLDHEHIAAIYDVLEAEGDTFLVMEYVEGLTLHERLRKPLSVEECLSIATQCAEALAAAHEKGIVHHDVKPDNIMLTPKGRVKILDFGIARHLPGPETSTTSENTGPDTFRGTPAYMSPEALLAKEPDARSDIFSLGVVLYEALAGRHPFLSESFIATGDRILHETPAPLRRFNRQVPAELERIITGMMAKEPAERIASAESLLAELRSVELEAARPRGLDLSWATRTTRRKAATAAVSVAAVLALVLLAFPAIIRQLRRAPTPIASPQQRQLAVLPAVALDSDPATAAFATDLTARLNDGLARLIQRYSFHATSANQVREKQVSTPEEALKEFGASLVLETSVEQSGGNIRVSYLLTDAPTQRQLRGDTIAGPATDPGALKDEAARRVLAALELELAARESDFARAYGTSQPAAYDYFWRGRRLLLDFQEPKNVEAAITVFKYALEKDPQFAIAHAGLGEAYLRRYEESKDPVWVPRALEACRSAVLNGSELPHGHACLGMVYNDTGKYEEAITAFGRALSLDPNYVEALQGQAHAYEMLRRPEEAEEIFRRALRLRPGYWGGYRDVGQFYNRQGRYADAATMFQREIELAPENPWGYVSLGGMYYQQGRWEEARALFEKSLAVRPTYEAYNNLATVYFFKERNYAKAAQMFEKVLEFNDKDYSVWGSLAATYYWAPGERTKARAAYERAVKMAEERRAVNPRDPQLLGDLADYYAMLGRREKALPLLQEALALAPNDVQLMFNAGDTYEQLGRREESLNLIGKALRSGYPIEFVERSPGLAKLRADPRFQKLRTNP